MVKFASALVTLLAAVTASGQLTTFGSDAVFASATGAEIVATFALDAGVALDRQYPGIDFNGADGFGMRCDADFNNDCVVNAIDLGLLRVAFFGTDPLFELKHLAAFEVVKDRGWKPLLRRRHRSDLAPTRCSS